VPALVFLALVAAELYAAVFVAGQIGVLNTIALMILISMIGGAVVKRAGLGVVRRAQATIAEGGTPHRELVDGLLLLFAGILLVVPGFVTDAVGLVLLLPPVRALLRVWLVRSFKRRTSYAVRFVDGFGRRVDIRGGGGVHDVSATEVNDPPPRPPELGA
jgi:UPF0716 protein FxsA